ncbi:serine/threonine-protein phosphatase 5-like [Entamoeba marina]
MSSLLHESLIEKKPIYTEDDIELSFLWSDPQLRNGSSPSPRGVGRTFGPDVLNKFLIDNNLKYIVRSHEVKVSGFEWDITGKLLTIFSAPKYGGVNNVGAFADIWFDEESVDILPHFSVQTFCDFDSRDNLI